MSTDDSGSGGSGGGSGNGNGIVVNSTFSATVGSITTHPHFCSWCHKQYASKAKLMQHQRKKHPEKVVLMTSSSSSSSISNTVSSSSLLTKAALKTISAGDISFASSSITTTSDSSVKSPGDGGLDDSSLSGTLSPLKMMVDVQAMNVDHAQQISLMSSQYSAQMKGGDQQKMGIGGGSSNNYITVLPTTSNTGGVHHHHQLQLQQQQQQQFSLDSFGQLTVPPTTSNQGYSLQLTGGKSTNAFGNGNGGLQHFQQQQQQYAALDAHDQSLEDLLTMVGGGVGDDGGVVGGVGGQLNGSGGGAVQNNIITILSKQLSLLFD